MLLSPNGNVMLLSPNGSVPSTADAEATVHDYDIPWSDKGNYGNRSKNRDLNLHVMVDKTVKMAVVLGVWKGRVV